MGSIQMTEQVHEQEQSCSLSMRGGNVAQLLQRGTCAMACANTCEHVEGPVAHVRVWWIVETQFGGLWKHLSLIHI